MNRHVLASPAPLPFLTVDRSARRPSATERWPGWCGALLSLLAHLGLLWAWAGIDSEPLRLPPPDGSLGEAARPTLSVLLLDREQAAPSLRPVPPMPRPPQRPMRAAAAPVAPVTVPNPEPPVITASALPVPAPAEPPVATADPSPEAPSDVAPEASQPSPDTQRVALPTGRKARREQQRYLQDLMAWLARHRTYPDAAKKAKLQGVVHVRFTLDRQGRLLASAVDRGPGIAVLERAAMDVLQRASPMPPIPESMGISKLTLTLPIEYSLLTD